MPTLTLYNGDCLEVMKEIPDKSVDLIICDLPYGCLAGGPAIGKGKERVIASGLTGCSWDIKINLEAFWKQIRRIRKSDNSPTIHFCTTKFGYELIQSNRDEFRYDLVWDKQRGVSFLSVGKMPMRSHEMIYIFSKVGAYYERKDIEGDFKAWKYKIKGAPYEISSQYGSVKKNDTEGGDGKRSALSVIQAYVSRTKNGHPTEKPESLYRFLIERYCPTDGTVLDPTFGSGNSVFTAFSLGRNAIGIEKDEKFYEKAETRLNALPG